MNPSQRKRKNETMQRKTETRKIATHFLCALVNGDYSGLNEQEAQLLDAWLKANNYGHAICPDNTETDFKICEITNLYSDVIDVEFYLL